MLRLLALTLPILSSLVVAANAQDRTFGGYECTDDCEGHSAGFKWAERKGIEDSEHCPYGNSQSFHEGCLAYTQDPTHDPDEDDDGNPTGSPIVPPEDR